MGTAVLHCTKGTFLSYINPSSDNSSTTEIPTSFWGVFDIQNDASRISGFISAANLEDQTQGAEHHDFGLALLEFEDLEGALHGHYVIESIQLDTKISGEIGSDTDPEYEKLAPYASQYPNNDVRIYSYAYKSSEQIENINLNNYKEKGNCFEAIRNNNQIVYNLTEATISKSVGSTYIENCYFAQEKSARFLITIGDDSQYYDTPNNCCAKKIVTGEADDYIIKKLSIADTYLTVVYSESPIEPPTPLMPEENQLFKDDVAIEFAWRYNSLAPQTQKSAEIKYRTLGSDEWTVYTLNSDETSVEISDIPQGQYEWCVNTSNYYNETSEDSEIKHFNVIGRPATPEINEPDNCCLTTISWNASGQEAAEFILMDGDGNVLIHETVATAVTSYKPQMFLKGSYKAMARIKNNSDLWSDYGELEFDIDAAEPDPGNLIAMPFDTEIHLEGTYTSTNVAIVRIDEDGTETVLAMDDHAVDKKVAGGTEYAYVLRSWDTGGYIDTPAKIFDFKFEGAIFSTETEELHLDRSEQKFLAHDEEIERQYAQMRYVGREFAVIERGEYTEQTLSKQFHVTRAQRKVLDRMAKEKSLFYRDSRGNAFKAAILNVSYTNYMDNDYIASIRLTRTAADEVIINV